MNWLGLFVLAKTKPNLSWLKEKHRWCISNSDVSWNDRVEIATEPSYGRVCEPEPEVISKSDNWLSTCYPCFPSRAQFIVSFFLTAPICSQFHGGIWGSTDPIFTWGPIRNGDHQFYSWCQFEISRRWNLILLAGAYLCSNQLWVVSRVMK